VYREAKSEFESRGFFKARERLGRRNFFRLIAATAHYWMEPIAQAVRSGKVNVVVLDSRTQVLPLVFLPRRFLRANGFRRALKTDHFTVWKREFSLQGQPMAP
jgi:hypothetical protein